MNQQTGRSSVAMARCGWHSLFPEFADTDPHVIRVSLQEFLEEVSGSQVYAWDDSIPKLQHEVGEVVELDTKAGTYTAILEYELPLESRRPDVIFLVNGAVVVVELKARASVTQADIDQAAAYARDLRVYHRHCHEREVHAILVPTRLTGYAGARDGVHICGPDALHDLIQRLQQPWPATPIPASEFLRRDAYCPLPTLVEAARELFLHNRIRAIHRARACTDPAVQTISRIAHEAARTRTRHLVLVTGVPGSGKTLVGLRVVHSPELADLAVARADGKPTAPAVFLSGNGPLVQVLHYELRAAGGGGKAFVRDVKNYVKYFLGNPTAVPPQHVIVYDEAQRAWDKEQVEAKHALPEVKSEPEAFVEFGERIPQWCVLVGLIGTGQEIHVGEEAGLAQWQQALERAADPARWTVHGPAHVLNEVFRRPGATYAMQPDESLNLTVELRYHFAADLDEWVEELLSRADSSRARQLAERIESAGYHLRMTRNLDCAKSYLRDRFAEDPDARFGILASSRDRDLEHFGIANDWYSTRGVQLGPWYGEGEDDPRSCRHLRECVTEFGAQGLELDGALLAWGSDLIWTGSEWSNARARPHARNQHVRNPLQLRLNAYRVLLTRGRDCTVIFVPPLPLLDQTAARLQEFGVRMLDP